MSGELTAYERETLIQEFGHIAGRFAVNRQTPAGPPAWSLTLAQMPQIIEASVYPAVERILAARRGSLAERVSQNWQAFRTHRPVGAYLPVGQLDGDCRECGGEWPCTTIRALLDPSETP